MREWCRGSTVGLDPISARSIRASRSAAMLKRYHDALPKRCRRFNSGLLHGLEFPFKIHRGCGVMVARLLCKRKIWEFNSSRLQGLEFPKNSQGGGVRLRLAIMRVHPRSALVAYSDPRFGVGSSPTCPSVVVFA